MDTRKGGGKMENIKYWALLIAVLFSIVAVPSLSVAQGPPTRIYESFALGTTGCQMNLVLQDDEVLEAAVGPAFEPPTVPEPVVIDTDSTWLAWAPDPIECTSLACPSPGAGWNTNILFDTTELTGWKSAAVVKAAPCSETFLGACIWYDTFESGDHNVYFRKTFNIIGSIQTATITGGFDDDGQIFVNGNSVYLDSSEDATDFGPLDIASSLVPGTNLIAVYAQDVQDPVNNFHARLVINSSGVPNPPTGIIINSLLTSSLSIPSASCAETGGLPIEDITNTLICDDDGNGNPINCKPKTAVERNIMEKSGDGSQYCYYTTKGQQVCKTI
jgi:hypothetical protein